MDVKELHFSPEMRERLTKAKQVTALTGAGISAASGIPTFRGKQGLWKKYRPEELANFQAFKTDPRLVWEWYLWRRQLISGVRPNEAHFALAEMEKRYDDFMLITQNVDNLHYEAGNRKIIELHGNIMRSKCSDCQEPYQGEISLQDGIPQCGKCEGLIRPDVVWFGEMLPMGSIQAAQKVAEESEIVLVIGTSGVVEPAASLPFLAKDKGAFVAEINLEKTPLSSYADVSFLKPADRVLPKLLEIITG